MSSFSKGLLVVSVGLVSIILYGLNQKYNTAKSMDVLTLQKKFGTMPALTAHFKPIVRLVDQSGKGFCTAFVVDANYAITAAHCINSEGRLSKVKIKLFDSEGNDTGIEAMSAGYHTVSDLGLLTGDFSEFVPLDVSFSEENFPPKAETVYISCGFPWAQKKLVCTQFIPSNTNFTTIEGRGHLVPGMSGGPIINSQGTAVGVNYAITDHSVLINPTEGLLGLFGIE